MFSKTPLYAILVVGALALPSATALWSAHGAFEPDYPADVAAGLMWADPDTNPDTGVRKVYFNAFLAPGYWTGLNPNVGATQSRIVSAGFQAPMAFLGVWKDCNNDGYIGSAESAITEYRDELLLDKSICPAQPGATGAVHNDGKWVYEFLWIADGANYRFNNQIPRFINDTDAYVWGDPGLPSSEATLGCFINPQTGTFSSTSAVLAYADCNGRRGVTDTWNQVIDNTTSSDPELNQKLRFDDTTYPQCGDQDHPLYVHTNLFADDPRCDSGKPGRLEQNTGDGNEAFTVWSCSSGSAQLTTPTVNPEGSFWDGANHTVRGAEHGKCSQSDTTTTSLSHPNDPNMNGASTYEVINQEADVASGVAAQRDTTFYFTFDHQVVTNSYGGVCHSRLGGCTPSLFSEPQPGFAGVGYLNTMLGFWHPMWTSNIAQTNSPPTVSIETLQPQGPRYYTFYARVSDQTTGTAGAQVPGGSGVYGSEICGSNTTDVIGGFDCDASRWWKEEHGASAMPYSDYTNRPLGQVPGAPYNLRDIDCYDGSVASKEAPGVGVGLTWLAEEGSGNGPCANL